MTKIEQNNYIIRLISDDGTVKLNRVVNKYTNVI
jgi:hypothetical protein